MSRFLRAAGTFFSTNGRRWCLPTSVAPEVRKHALVCGMQAREMEAGYFRHHVATGGNFMVLVSHAPGSSLKAAIGRRKRRESICLTEMTRSIYNELSTLENVGLRVSIGLV